MSQPYNIIMRTHDHIQYLCSVCADFKPNFDLCNVHNIDDEEGFNFIAF